MNPLVVKISLNKVTSNFLDCTTKGATAADIFKQLEAPRSLYSSPGYNNNISQPEALKSLYRSPGNKKNQLVLCKNYVLQW